MKVQRTIIIVTLVLCHGLCVRAQSVLHTGNWYKFAIERPGVYRISFDLLRKAGIDPSRIDPRHIRVYGQKGGMLPQPNSIERPVDLLECAIHVAGEADGRFDKGDYILFYGEGPDQYAYDGVRDIFRYENNIYSDQNYYFLTVGSDPGKRIASAENIPGDYPLISTFNAFSFYEKDAVNIDRSGREWYGEKFGVEPVYTLTYNLPGIAPDSRIRIVSDVMAQSYAEVTFKLAVNGVTIGEQKIGAIPNGRYDVKGLHKRDTLTIGANDVNAPSRSSQEVRYEFAKASGYSQGYLNFILFDFIRELALYDNQTPFLSQASTAHATSTFQIASVTNDTRIWDVTDHYAAKEQQFVTNGSVAEFSATTSDLRQWIVFNGRHPEPVFIKRVGNRDLLGIHTPNLLIITHEDFRTDAERLAAHRSSFSQWTTQVVTTEEIYNQFSGGRQDVTAMRDFAKLLRDKDPSALRSILLFGRASYDYKDRIVNNTNFVPTYQSRNSLHPLQTYSSDDYFAFLEDSEGMWPETPLDAHTLDVGVGRIPVTTVDQARIVVDKIIAYETGKESLGSWRRKIVFVADDGNSEDGFTSLHQYQADQIASSIEQDHPSFDARRLFMGSYKKIVQPNGEQVPELIDDLKRAFDLGALIINFTGHGSETVWTDERILTQNTVSELRNDRYPFLVTATCEFGRQDDPLQISSAEQMLTHEGGGAIGLVTTARPVTANTNFGLNQAFYEALLAQGENGHPTIGEVFQKTKNNSTSGVANRNFSLIGDPSMVLALPQHKAEVTYAKTSSGSDTLKALATVTIKGHVLAPAGGISTDFNGIVEATLYDKERKFVTIGRNDPPFQYQQWDNAVFRGTATVEAGAFELTFVMPKNISAEVAPGRLAIYAFDPTSRVDAMGVHTSTKIGGVEPNPGDDITPPTIKLFMGDSTFVNGGITSPDTYLIARLEDFSGINISAMDTSHSIIAEMDGGQRRFVLNDYYVSGPDTSKKGWIRFPMPGLPPGPHEITLYASDVYNNRSQASVSFIVTDGSEIVIEDFGNYPNPFTHSTTLFFTHNRSGDDLKAQLFIFNLTGQLITSAEISVSESEYHIDLLELNTFDTSGKKLLPGLYLARVVVRSMTNGSKNEKVTKLIVSN